MADQLQKLFGSPARVRLLRLFLFNPKHSFTAADAAVRSRSDIDEARGEVALFSRIGLLEKARRGAGRYQLNDAFEYREALQNLLLNAPSQAQEIPELLRGTGVIKLVILSGVFVGEWESQVDLLIAGDRLKERILRDRIRRLESEVGKELRYSVLESSDLLYRLNMNDKLVRDVLDYPHSVVLNKLGVIFK